MDQKLSDWESKLEHVQRKAKETGTESPWLEHAMKKRDDVRNLIDALRDQDESEFEVQKPHIAIRAEEFEVALVRAAERFEETAELELDPGARKAQPHAEDQEEQERGA